MNSGMHEILKMITKLLDAEGIILQSNHSELNNIYYFNSKINKKIVQDVLNGLKNLTNKDTISDLESILELNKKLSADLVNHKMNPKSDDSILIFVNSQKRQTIEEKIVQSQPSVDYLYNYISENENNQMLKYRFNEIVENISATLYSSDKNATKYYFVSSSIKKLLGVTPDEMYKNRYTILRSILPQDFHLVKNFIRKVGRGQYAEVDYRYIDIGGNVKHVRHTGSPIFEKEKVVRVVGMIKDITTEKLLIDQLTKSEDKLNLLLSTTSSLIFSLDRSGYFISVNSKGALELGYNVKDMLGKHFLEFIDEDCKADIAIAFQKILTSNETVDFEAEFIDSFGKKIIYGVQAKSNREEGKVTSLLGIGRDITHKRKDQSKLNELNSKLTEANRIISIERDRAKHQITVLEELSKLKNDFISNVSHELRTPLASIVGFAETIASDEDLPKEMALEFNNIILTEGKRLAKLVNDILDFSKLETDKDELNITTFDLILLLKELHKNYLGLSENKNIELIAELPEAEIIIAADRELISKCIGNLVSNGIKFTQEGGTVSIFTQDFLKEFEIVVADTGLGIPEKELSGLFEKFTKTNETQNLNSGAGLGLAAVKQIVELHQGHIQVSSEPGQGSSFIIRMPKNIK